MNREQEWIPHITKKVVSDALGWKLCAYLVALEGWRRGLTLTWYAAEFKKKNFIKAGKVHHGKMFSLASDKGMHYFYRSRGDQVAREAVLLCGDKEKTKTTLEKAGVPVPHGKKFSSETQNDEMINYAINIGFPVVLKPINGSLGKGVYTNIQNEAQLEEALSDLKLEPTFSQYIIEKYHPGQEYRVYVVGDKVEAATNRVPANVVGDGKNSLKKLIEMKNKERRKNPYLSKKPIQIDSEVMKFIKSNGYTIESVLKEGEIIYLREISNLSAGGDAIDATDELSDEVKQIAVNALKAIPHLPHAGLDIIVDPVSKKEGVVIEINATAEIGFHLFPLIGKGRDIPKAIIDYYFPDTIDKNRTNFYFDFKGVLEPLKTRSAGKIELPHPPLGKIYSRKYIVSGKVQNVNYRSWVRNKAVKNKMYGYAKNLDNGKVEIVVTGPKQKDVDDFERICNTGPNKAETKSVKKIIQKANRPHKMSFEIVPLEPKSKTRVSLDDYNNLKNKLANLEEDYKELEKKNNIYKKKNEKIENSTSWRVSQPIRKVGNFLKNKK